MAIYEGSRYQNQPVINVRKNAAGEREPAVYHQGFYPDQFEYQEHTMVEGERLDLLAYRYLGDSKLWWVIAAANPELEYPEPTPGQVIRVPRVA